MGRRYFGTDGVRGVVGEFLTPELVERLGRAAALWSGAERVFVGRDTRGLRDRARGRASPSGIVSAGATAVLGGVLPSAAVALGALDLGIMITASHNPAEYNGVKFFAAGGRKLTDAEEEAIEALLDAPAAASAGSVEARLDADAAYIDYVVEHFGSDLTGLDLVVDCANGACAGLAPEAFERLGATVHAIGNAPDGTNINAGCGATDTALLQRTVTERGAALGLAFDGDGDRLMAVDEHGEVVDGDGIVAILALDLGVSLVAVTQMTNLGFHALMARARDPRRHHRRRRPLRARGARARGRRARRRAVRPRDLPARPRHRRRARRGAAPLRGAPRPHARRGGRGAPAASPSARKTSASRRRS